MRLIASGAGKDHDRHPGNYLVEVRADPQSERTVIHVNHFDFGCADTGAPSFETLRETGIAFQRALDTMSLSSMLFNPRAITDSIALSLFERGSFAPGAASLPLGLIAALGANERVRLNGKERPLLEARDLARALKIGLQGATIPEELRLKLPGGIRGWIFSRAYTRLDAGGIRFSKIC
jgi:hypothetical protein